MPAPSRLPDAVFSESPEMPAFFAASMTDMIDSYEAPRSPETITRASGDVRWRRRRRSWREGISSSSLLKKILPLSWIVISEASSFYTCAVEERGRSTGIPRFMVMDMAKKMNATRRRKTTSMSGIISIRALRVCLLRIFIGHPTRTGRGHGSWRFIFPASLWPFSKSISRVVPYFSISWVVFSILDRNQL